MFGELGQSWFPGSPPVRMFFLPPFISSIISILQAVCLKTKVRHHTNPPYVDIACVKSLLMWIRVINGSFHCGPQLYILTIIEVIRGLYDY